jgi:hypothetical protein
MLCSIAVAGGTLSPDWCLVVTTKPPDGWAVRRQTDAEKKFWGAKSSHKWTKECSEAFLTKHSGPTSYRPKTWKYLQKKLSDVHGFLYEQEDSDEVTNTDADSDDRPIGRVRHVPPKADTSDSSSSSSSAKKRKRSIFVAFTVFLMPCTKSDNLVLAQQQRVLHEY